MQGRLFALMATLAVGGQSLGILVAGPLVSRVFQPLLESGGALEDSIGAIIGSGAGSGMAFIFILLGLIVLGMALFSWLNPSVRLLEERLPDYEVNR